MPVDSLGPTGRCAVAGRILQQTDTADLAPVIAGPGAQPARSGARTAQRSAVGDRRGRPSAPSALRDLRPGAFRSETLREVGLQPARARADISARTCLAASPLSRMLLVGHDLPIPERRHQSGVLLAPCGETVQLVRSDGGRPGVNCVRCAIPAVVRIPAVAERRRDRPGVVLERSGPAPMPAMRWASCGWEVPGCAGRRIRCPRGRP